MKLITSNPGKYHLFDDLLNYLNIEVTLDKRSCEIMQDDASIQILEKKARCFYEFYKSPVLVDDFSLYLEAYNNFPGSYTKFIMQTLGVQGLIKLIETLSSKCTVICRIGFWTGEKLIYSEGKISGNLEKNDILFDNDRNLPLSNYFTCNDTLGIFAARFHAIKKISKYLLADTCPFCCEFLYNSSTSIFRQYFKDLKHRFIDMTESFVLFPPLGQFIEGSLLLATKDHYTSFAELDEETLRELKLYLKRIINVVKDRYEITPIIFEHGSQKKHLKGSTVDHAHFNIYPINIDLHSYLSGKFQYIEIDSILELPKFRDKNYIFLQLNNGKTFVYTINSNLPSQFMRKVIAELTNMGNMWDWRNYLGENEFIKTIMKYKNSL